MFLGLYVKKVRVQFHVVIVYAICVRLVCLDLFVVFVCHPRPGVVKSL